MSYWPRCRVSKQPAGGYRLQGFSEIIRSRCLHFQAWNWPCLSGSPRTQGCLSQRYRLLVALSALLRWLGSHRPRKPAFLPAKKFPRQNFLENLNSD